MKNRARFLFSLLLIPFFVLPVYGQEPVSAEENLNQSKLNEFVSTLQFYGGYRGNTHQSQFVGIYGAQYFDQSSSFQESFYTPRGPVGMGNALVLWVGQKWWAFEGVMQFSRESHFRTKTTEATNGIGGPNPVVSKTVTDQTWAGNQLGAAFQLRLKTPLRVSPFAAASFEHNWWLKNNPKLTEEWTTYENGVQTGQGTRSYNLNWGLSSRVVRGRFGVMYQDKFQVIDLGYSTWHRLGGVFTKGEKEGIVYDILPGESILETSRFGEFSFTWLVRLGNWKKLKNEN